jgi:hypothetical protein
MGNIVELEIEKDPVATRAEFADRVRATGDEELKPNLDPENL